MVRPVSTKQADGGCLAVLSSYFRTNRKDRSPAANNPSGRTIPRNPGSETPQLETSLPASNSPGTPTPPTRNEELVQIQEKDLWREAFENIDDEAAKKQIKEAFEQSGDETPVHSLIRIVENQRDAFEKNSAKIKLNGREMIWRDNAAQVVGWLTALGDIAVQFAPAPSPIVWSALKVLLKTHVNECESFAAMLECTKQILPLIRRGAVYEVVYLTDSSNELLKSTSSSLREALVDLYKRVLQLLANAKHDLSANGGKRFLAALLHPEEGEKLIQDMEKAGEKLDSAAQACEAMQRKRDNTKLSGLIQSLDEPLRRVDKGVEAILKRMEEDELYKILETICRIYVGDQHRERTEYRTARTGQWLLKHRTFRDWESSSSSSILWLTGQMGAGKSILTSNVVDRYKPGDNGKSEPNDAGFAFFYYSKNDKSLAGNPVAHTLASLLRQLATVPRYPGRIYTGLSKLYHDMQKEQITFDGKRFKETLLQIVNLLPGTVIVLDGLDEFENERDIGSIVRFFGELVEKSERPVKIFISSRGESYIRDELFKFKQILTRIDFSDENQPDIEEYVKTRIEDISHRWGTEVKDEVQTTLCDKARGMFRWVYLQIEQLARINSPEAVRKRLRSLPKGLEEAYDELYNGVYEVDRMFLQRAVKWVMYSRRPLSTSKLLSAVRLYLNNVDGEPCLNIDDYLSEPALESICRHLIVKDSQDYWKFPHASVEEYFIGEKHRSWTTDDAQAELAKLSLLLLPKAFQNLQLPESNEEAYAIIYAADRTAQDPVVSLRNYAAEHWISHIKAIRCKAECTRVSGLLKRFMVAQDDPWRSTSAYQAWARYADLVDIRSLDTRLFTRSLEPSENPSFGITAMGLHTLAARWGENCLKQNLNNFNSVGRDLLSIAAKYGHTELCVGLIELGSNVNRILPFKNSALLEAVLNGQATCVGKLLEHGADPNLETNIRSLCAATRVYKPEIVEHLLRYNANPDAICASCRYDCALEAAVYPEKLDVAEKLIEAGATIDLRIKRFGSPLAAAAYHGSLDIAKLLVRHGADVNIRLETDPFGGVLAVAFYGWGGARMIAYLIEEAGADPQRFVSDVLVRKPMRSFVDTSIRHDTAKYLYHHNHITRDEFSNLNAQYPGLVSHEVLDYFRRIEYRAKNMQEIRAIMAARSSSEVTGSASYGNEPNREENSAQVRC
ncbi:hypothetical protein F4679DRAFT_557848, partial [Xylaria curta]